MKMSVVGIARAVILVTFAGAIAAPQFASGQAAAPTAGPGNGNWQPIRPTQEQHGADAGRINVLAFDPSSPSTIYIGAPTAGVWRSLDNGDTWASLTDALNNTAITDIAVDPQTPQTIYILTGDGDDAAMNPTAGLAPYSDGVRKSVDGGQTWQQTSVAWKLSDHAIGHRLAINPKNPQILLLATNGGLLRTTDGFQHSSTVKTTDGAALTASPGNPFYDVMFNPADPSVAYAASQTNVYRSDDGGETWQQLGGGLPTVSIRTNNRIRLGVSAAGPDTLYALYGAPDGFSNGLWRSDDRGEHFTLQSRSNQRPSSTNRTPPFDLSRPNILHKLNDYDGSQTGYTLAMTVSPTDVNQVRVGGLDVWKSDDGGKTWTQSSDWQAPMGALNYTHADIHDLAFHDNALYVASDGGAYRSTDGGVTYQGKNNITLGGGITQIYSICTTPQDPNLIYYGAQDNGSWKLEVDGTLTSVLGGDGAICQINPADSNTVYLSYVNGNIERSDDGGSHLTDITPQGAAPGAWITPYLLGVNDPNMVYACYADLWVSRRGFSWTNLSKGALGPSNQCTQIGLTASDPNTIYLAKADQYYNRVTPGGANLPPFLGGGGVFRSNDGGNTWNTITGTLPLADAVIAGLAVSPTDARRAWVTFLGFQADKKVFETKDGGATWTNLSTGLKNVSVNVVVALNSPANGIFIGTDDGVYYRDDRSDDWIPFSNGMRRSIITALTIDATHNRLYAGTYGRGVWHTDLPPP